MRLIFGRYHLFEGIAIFPHQYGRNINMATITAGDFRNGKTFEMDGKVMQVVEF